MAAAVIAVHHARKLQEPQRHNVYRMKAEASDNLNAAPVSVFEIVVDRVTLASDFLGKSLRVQIHSGPETQRSVCQTRSARADRRTGGTTDYEDEEELNWDAEASFGERKRFVFEGVNDVLKFRLMVCNKLLPNKAVAECELSLAEAMMRIHHEAPSKDARMHQRLDLLQLQKPVKGQPLLSADDAVRLGELQVTISCRSSFLGLEGGPAALRYIRLGSFDSEPAPPSIFDLEGWTNESFKDMEAMELVANHLRQIHTDLQLLVQSAKLPTKHSRKRGSYRRDSRNTSCDENLYRSMTSTEEHRSDPDMGPYGSEFTDSI